MTNFYPEFYVPPPPGGVLNRPNFANPSNDVATPGTFGVISALTVNPRIMQYGLKLEF